jgi:diguanylate cyclase (GGDEF)-like protein
MIHIDPRTVLLLTGVMSGFMAVILYALKRSYPPAIQGMGEWVVALMLVGVGSLLAFGVGYFPTVVSITLPRLLFPLGLFLCYVGMQRFFGVAPRFRRWVVLIAGVALVQMWFTFVQPSFHARLVLAIGLVLCLFLAMANLLRQQQPASIAKRLTMGVVVVMLSILIMRLVTSLVFPVGSGIFDASPQQLLYVTSFSFLIVLLSVGLVLMATERLHAELSFLATHDSLTNALTRRHLNAVCAIELDRSQRHGRSMALLIMDLDYFKAVNDNHGHLRGDRVLVDFVATANRLLRRPDQLARFGGEEFVALLPETSLEEALGVAERIRQACALPSPETACTVSIGVTTNHTAGDTVDTLIARADAAMYQAKAKGRNRVESA